jgi:hypothetical protein
LHGGGARTEDVILTIKKNVRKGTLVFGPFPDGFLVVLMRNTTL